MAGFDDVVRELIERFTSREVGELLAKPALDSLPERMPPAFFDSPLKSSSFLESEPASKTLLPELLERSGVQIGKSEYFRIAEQMLPEEIPVEIGKKLDAIAEAVL